VTWDGYKWWKTKHELSVILKFNSNIPKNTGTHCSEEENNRRRGTNKVIFNKTDKTTLHSNK
jgi:hypothetical protein